MAIGTTKAKPKVTNVTHPSQERPQLKALGGSQSDAWNNILANQTIQSLWLTHSNEDDRDKQFKATAAALIGIAPKDEIEGMLAAQLIAAHNAAMECYRRAMLAEQTFEGRHERAHPGGPTQAMPRIRPNRSSGSSVRSETSVGSTVG